MRREIPGLVIKVCASGIHRLDPSILGLPIMSLFSDAHESFEIPIIADNLHWLILPRKSQIWAVLHTSDTMQRLASSLAANFLCRRCLTNDIDQLNDKQWVLMQEVIRFVEQVTPIIKNGRNHLYQQIGVA